MRGGRLARPFVPLPQGVPCPTPTSAGDRLKQHWLAASCPRGGFTPFPGQSFCPASSTWAVLALPPGHALAAPVPTRLISAMLPDGRLPSHPEHPQAIWPTTPALLALIGTDILSGATGRLSAFFLATSGVHWPHGPESPPDNDTNLRG